MAETVVDDPFQSKERQELVEQAEQRNKLFRDLDREFLGGVAPSTPRNLEDYDRLIREAEALGGAYRPSGNEGLPDANFEGGQLRGATPEWQAILDAIRAGKNDYIRANAGSIATEFTINTANPDAQRQPVEYINEQLQWLVDRGLVKHETGRTAQPDGLFGGNQLMATSPDIEAELRRFRTEAETLIKDRLTTRIDDRLDPLAGNEKEQGKAFGGELRDLALRGFIELRGGKKDADPIEIVAVADPKASELSRVYSDYLASRRATLESDPDAKDALATYLKSIHRQLNEIKNQGNANRADLMAGRDAEKTSAARKKIDDLNKAAQMKAEQDRAERSYAGNIAATQTRETNEEADRRLAWMRAQQAEFRTAGVPLPRPSDSDAVREAKLARVAEFQMNRALQEDRGANEQQIMRERYGARIAAVEARMAATPNRATREELRRQIAAIEEERDAQVNALAQMQRAVAPQATREAVDAVIRAQEGEHSYSPINANDENFRERAATRREALGLEPVPFFEKRRGAILESYFRIPGNPNVVVMERYDRRSGRILSQNMWSTENDVTGNFRGSGWRREIADEVDSTRNQDRQTAAATSRAGFWRRLRYGAGFGSTRSIDGTAGIYSTYATNAAQRNRVAQHARGGNRLRFWLTGGRAQRN